MQRTPSLHIRLLRAIAVLVAAGLLAAACGDDDAAGPADPGKTDPVPSDGATSATDALLVELAASTADASRGAPVTHVGAVDGTRALVAVAQGDDGAVVAYVCDGEQLSSWYVGVADGDSAELRETDGSGRLIVTGLDAGTLTGDAVVGGREHTFSAERAETGGDALLRLVEDAATTRSVTGWILHGDVLRGATKAGREVTGSASVDDLGVVEDTGAPAGDDEAAIRLFPKVGCRRKARTVIQTPMSSDAWGPALEDFIRSGCAVESFMPGANIDSTDNLCLIYGVPLESCGLIQ